MKQNSCIHCERPAYKSSQFCCDGCKIAYQIINESGFADYYQNRIIENQNNESGQPIKPEEFVEISNIEQFISKDKSNTHEINLIIHGIHCATCIWLIENILHKQPNITHAKINFTSKRLQIKWQGNKNAANDFIKLIYNIGYKALPFDQEIIRKEEQKYNNDILKALAVAGFAAGNVMLLSIALWSSDIFSMGKFTRTLLHWTSALFALPAIIYSGRIFLFSAFRALKNKTTNMDVPISVAIIITSIVSIFQTFTQEEHAYFDSAIMLVFFLLIGRYLDFKVRKKAFSTISKLNLLAGNMANLVTKNGEIKMILNRDIKKNMIWLLQWMLMAHMTLET